MDARHSHSSVRSKRTTLTQFRGAVLATIAIAIAGAATMLSGLESRAGAPPGTHAVGDDGKDLILRIENSTFPTPPSGSETSPWSDQR